MEPSFSSESGSVCSTRVSPAKSLQNSLQTRVIPVQTAAAVSPSSSVAEMIDYVSPVSSDSVDFFLMLAKRFTDKKDLPMALEYFSRALRMVNKVAAKSDTEQLLMSDVLYEIGCIHMNLKDLPKSLFVFDLCHSIRRQLLDWDDKRNAIVLQQQARIYSLVGDSDSAVHVLEELLGILCCAEDDRKSLRETWLELARHQEILGMEAEASSSREEAGQLQ